MFGHQNNDEQANAAAPVAADAPAAHQPETIAPTAATSAPTVGDTGGYTATDLPHVATAAATTPSVTPAQAATPSTPSTEPAAAPRPATTPSAAPQADEDDLISLKQTALHELSPLIGHLDQTPEDKFRTTMMMIQASDDQSLLPAALAAAKQIKDEKTRAQALLDVVNEINYFTQQHEA